MSNTAHCVKRFGKLAAADAASDVVLRSIPEGEVVRLEITRPSRRSVAMHRLYFALLNTTAEQIDWSVEALLVWCKIAAGHCDAVVEPRTGEVHMIPRSISFARMDQSSFDDFFRRSVDAILERLLPPGTSRSDLIEEVNERAGMRRVAA